MEMRWRSKNYLVRLLADCKEQWGWLSLFILLYFLAGLFKSQIALCFGQMTDLVLANGITVALQYVWELVALLALEWLRGTVTYIVSAQTTERMFFNMKMKMFKKLSLLQAGELKSKLSSGDIVTRVNSDLNSLCEDFAGKYTWYLRVFFSAVIAFVSCVYISWQLSIVYFLLMPATFWLINNISRPIREKQKTIMQGIGKGMNIANEALGAIVTVKSYGLESKMDCKFGAHVDYVSEVEIENEKYNIKMIAVRYIGDILPMVMMLSVGTVLVSYRIISPGSVIAFSTLCGSVRSLLEISNNIVRTYRSSMATCERVYEILDLPEETSGKVMCENCESPVVCVQGLSFAYDAGVPVLNDISFTVQRGQRVALVGKSGSGKSTLLSLICKFFSPLSSNGGQLKLWGVPVQEWDNEALRLRLALVSQDTIIFQDTIRNNVSCGDKNAVDDDIIQALKRANLWEFVDSLSEKINTRIGEGGLQLSGGQRQRIAIARAFFKDAALLLMDEPTSALDTNAEREVQTALNALAEGRTSIVVAHRLHTLRDMDCIYVFDKGYIVESGTWDELYQKKGEFYQLLVTRSKGNKAC